MNLIKKNIVIISIFFGLVLSACTETIAINEVVSTDEPTIISATEIPEVEIEEAITPIQKPTIVIVPTALIDNIEYYFTEFNDINNWVIYSKNLSSDYYHESEEVGLHLTLNENDDFFNAYSNVFGRDTVVEASINFLDVDSSSVFQLICRSNDNGEYLFELDANGQWGIGNNNFASHEVLISGEWQNENPASDELVIIISCNQDMLSLNINGNLIGQVSDQIYFEGYTGFGYSNNNISPSSLMVKYFFVSSP